VGAGLAGFMIWELSQDHDPATGDEPLLDALAGPLCSGRETICDDGADNDADTLTDCADPDCDAAMHCCLLHPDRDCDGDGALNAADCAPDDGGAFAVPERLVLAVRKPAAAGGAAEISWTDLAAQAGAGILYDLASGTIAALGPAFPGAACLSDDGPAASYTDGRSAGGGGTDGFWYLVRGENVCGQGPYGRAPLEGAAVCD